VSWRSAEFIPLLTTWQNKFCTPAILPTLSGKYSYFSLSLFKKLQEGLQGRLDLQVVDQMANTRFHLNIILRQLGRLLHQGVQFLLQLI
jgi:hypothetical protein